MSTNSNFSFMLALLAFCLIRSTSARNYIQPEERHVCVGSCQDWSGYLQWNTSVNYTALDYYVALCTIPLRLKSIYRCAQQYCSETDIEDGLTFFNHTCIVEANSTIPAFADLALPQNELARATQISKSYLATPYAFSEAVIPDPGWAGESLRTLKAYFGNFWLSYHYTWLLYGFWIVLLSTSAAIRLLKTPFASFHRTITLRKNFGTIQTWLKRMLLIPATFGRHCHEKTGYGTVPPRSESIIISLYSLMSIVMCFPAYDVFSNNNWWPDKTGLQLVRYIADRTAVLSIAQLPLIWLFSARNNPFRSFTSFTYASFNRFHRWVARLSVLLAIVHSVAWTIKCICFYSLELYLQAFKLQWFITGVFATITMAFMLPLAYSWLREKHYDLFLVSHISMAIIFLVTLYYHIQIYYHYFDGYIWPCLAIWIYDRYVRIVRTAYMSAMPFFMYDAKAIATYDSSADIIRLDVSGFFNDKSFRPGVYYFLYLPPSLSGWQSHPFTLCSWTEKRSVELTSLPLAKSGSGIQSSRLSESSSLEDLLDPTVIKRSILIRPHNGFTRKLRDRILSSKSTNSIELTVLMEGPYGHRRNLSHHSDVLLIVGGSGIVTAISHIHHLLSNSQTEVHLIWMTPQKQFVADVCKHELAAVMNDPNLHMTVYLTAESDDTQITFSRALEDVRTGRPNVLTVMREVRANCKRDLAVLSSGPPALMDTCRAAVVKLLKESGPRLDYVVGDTPWS